MAISSINRKLQAGHINGSFPFLVKKNILERLVQKISGLIQGIFHFIHRISNCLWKSSSMDSINPLGIVPNPGQGDCLFYSFSEGLKRRGFGEISHQDLRSQAATWLKNHLNCESIQISLLGALMEYQERCIEEINNQNELLYSYEDKAAGREKILIENQLKRDWVEQLDIQQYLDLLTQKGFFADETALVALAEIYQVPVRIESYYQDGTKRSAREIEIKESSKRALVLRYQGCHYEYQEKANLLNNS